MSDDRFADDLRTALAARRPSPSRQLADRLEAVAQHPVRPRLFAPAVLALAVAAGALLVVATRPGPRAESSESSEPSELSKASEPSEPAAISPTGGGGTPTPAPTASPTPAPTATPTPAPTAAPTPAPTAAPAKVDVRDPLAGYQTVLDGASSVSITPAQLAQLRKLASDLAGQRAYLADRKREAEAELARALAATSPDDGRVLAAYDRIAAQDAALGRAQLVARLGARGVLDARQRAAIEPTTPRAAVESATPRPDAKRSRVTIRSSIVGTVYINGKRVGDTPLILPVPAGAYDVRLEAPGWDPATSHFSVGDSSNIVLDLDPHKRRSTTTTMSASVSDPGEGSGHLTLTTKPPTRIYVDGVPVGQTPIQRTLAPGRHEIKMVGEDQRIRKTMTLDVTAGQQSNLSFSFDD
jgi:Spy/CpxP family protein refolding chaperone